MNPFPGSLPPNTVVANISPVPAPAQAVQISRLITGSLFTPTASGTVPGSGGGTINFLRADGTWASAGVGSIFTTIASGLVPAPGGTALNNFLRTDGTWALPLVFGTTAAGLVPSPGGATGRFLRDDGSWIIPATGGVGQPGGATTQIQYNSLGVLAGDPNFTWTKPAGAAHGLLNVGNPPSGTVGGLHVSAGFTPNVSGDPNLLWNSKVDTVWDANQYNYLNTGFTTAESMAITSTISTGQNLYPGYFGGSKKTYLCLNLSQIAAPGAGQKFLMSGTGTFYGMGDSAIKTFHLTYNGGPISGDEGQGYALVEVVQQDTSVYSGNITQVIAKSTASTFIKIVGQAGGAVLTPPQSPPASMKIPVVDATNINVGDWLVIDPAISRSAGWNSTVTVTLANPAVFTTPNPHGLIVGQIITLSTAGTLPVAFTAGTQYFVSAVTSTTFQLTDVPGGTSLSTLGQTAPSQTVTATLLTTSTHVSPNDDLVQVTAVDVPGKTFSAVMQVPHYNGVAVVPATGVVIDNNAGIGEQRLLVLAGGTPAPAIYNTGTITGITTDLLGFNASGTNWTPGMVGGDQTYAMGAISLEVDKITNPIGVVPVYGNGAITALALTWTAGSGYTPGTYTVLLNGGCGMGAAARITVGAGGTVTAAALYAPAATTVTFTGTPTNTVNWTAHGLVNGQVLFFTNSGGALPGGLTANVNYWVIGATANTFQLAATQGGAALTLTGNGTGTTTANVLGGIEYLGTDVLHASALPGTGGNSFAINIGTANNPVGQSWFWIQGLNQPTPTTSLNTMSNTIVGISGYAGTFPGSAATTRYVIRPALRILRLDPLSGIIWCGPSSFPISVGQSVICPACPYADVTGENKHYAHFLPGGALRDYYVWTNTGIRRFQNGLRVEGWGTATGTLDTANRDNYGLATGITVLGANTGLQIQDSGGALLPGGVGPGAGLLLQTGNTLANFPNFGTIRFSSQDYAGSLGPTIIGGLPATRWNVGNGSSFAFVVNDGNLDFIPTAATTADKRARMIWPTTIAVGRIVSSQTDVVGIAPDVTTGNGAPLIDMSQTWNGTLTFDLVKFTLTNTASNAASSILRFNVGGTDVFKVSPVGAATIAGPLSTGTPTTVTAATYTVAATDSSIIYNTAAANTTTLPAPASNNGRWLTVRTIAAFAISSASANVVPVTGGAAGTAILAGTAGKYAILQSDGTNWQIMVSN